MDSITIPLTKGYAAIIDAADAGLVANLRWFASVAPTKSGPYVLAKHTRRLNGRNIHTAMHRLILGAGPGECVDHINRNTLDNRRSNLRLAPRSGNSANRVFPTEWRGVFRRNERCSWYATLSWQGRRFYQGGFKSPEDAARAYDELARLHHGEFAVLNFPDHSPAPSEPEPSIA